MPKPNTHTSKRSSIELTVTRFIRDQRATGATAQAVASHMGRAVSTVSALLTKLTGEGYLTRTYEYEYDRRAKQQVGRYVYRLAE